MVDLVPHAGAMCLLDEVVDWRTDRIHCRSRMRAPALHPLSEGGELAVTALIEYAAQATAAHGTLLARAARGSASAASGRLAGLRDVEFPTEPEALADLEWIDVHAERLMADATGSIYGFRVVGDRQTFVQGRLTIRTIAAD